jgi:CBS-domain-containing membrane protein
MVKIRLTPLRAGEFCREFYGPGVVSMSRILWGSVGGGLLLGLVAVFSTFSGVGVLYPPLAASCFISTTCVYMRVARPKSVIVGHFISTAGGLLGVWVGQALFGGTEFSTAVKLGLAVLLASVFMQILDADHPPAAATAAIPAILSLPADPLVLPLHMAWGAVVTVVFSMAWNRFWFKNPSREPDATATDCIMNMERLELVGLSICTLGAVLMCFRPLSESTYGWGLAVMGAGVLLLSLYHFATAHIITGQ